MDNELLFNIFKDYSDDATAKRIARYLFIADIANLEDISKLSKRKVYSIRGIGKKHLNIIEEALKRKNLFFHGEAPGEQKLEDLFDALNYGSDAARVINILESCGVVTVQDVLSHPRKYYLGLYGISNKNIVYIDEALKIVNKSLI